MAVTITIFIKKRKDVSMKILRQLLLVSFLTINAASLNAAEEKSQYSNSPDNYSTPHSLSPMSDLNSSSTLHGAKKELSQEDKIKAATKIEAAFRGKQSRKRTNPLIEQAQEEKRVFNSALALIAEKAAAIDVEISMLEKDVNRLTAKALQENQFSAGSAEKDDARDEENNDHNQNETKKADDLFLELTKNTTTQDTENLHTLKNIIPQTSLSPQNKQHCLQKIEELLKNQTPSATQRAFSDEDSTSVAADDFEVPALCQFDDRAVTGLVADEALLESDSDSDTSIDTHLLIAETNNLCATVASNHSIIYPATLRGSELNTKGSKPSKTQATFNSEKDFFISDEDDAACQARWNAQAEKLSLWLAQQQKNTIACIASVQRQMQVDIQKIKNKFYK